MFFLFLSCTRDNTDSKNIFGSLILFMSSATLLALIHTNIDMAHRHH